MDALELQSGLRPRFELKSHVSREKLVGEAARRLGEPDCPFDGSVLEDHLWLCLPKGTRRLWSPTLELRLEQVGTGLRVHGQFGPAPGAWTFFMALYAFTVLMAGLAMVWGFSLWMLGQRPTILLALPVAGLLLVLLHAIARSGQQATQPQIHDLCHCVQSLVRELESDCATDSPKVDDLK
jgi:hypothetical protein